MLWLIIVTSSWLWCTNKNLGGVSVSLRCLVYRLKQGACFILLGIVADPAELVYAR